MRRRRCAAGGRARPAAAGARASAAGEKGVEVEALTRESLVAYVRSGCKPRSKWRIGTEHEKFGFYFEDSKRPLEYATIATLLESIAKNFEWDPIMEKDSIIGLRQGGQSVTLEPGGQFELSGAPLETIHLTCAEVNSHLYQVRAGGARAHSPAHRRPHFRDRARAEALPRDGRGLMPPTGGAPPPVFLTRPPSRACAPPCRSSPSRRSWAWASWAWASSPSGGARTST